MPNPAQDAVIAVVLAAGKGTRMKSDLPKVLHTLHGQSLIQHVVERVRRVGIRDIIVVVGYQREQVMAHLGASVRYAIQEEQLGTAHAVMMARPHLSNSTGRVLIAYGDMPLINPDTMKRLIDRCQGDVKASMLTIILENPPDFGRVVRGPDGRVLRIIEVRDADPETLTLREINVGMYCFECRALLAAFDRLSNNNAQKEYYLTDAIEAIASAGGRIETIVAPTVEETLGINEPGHLRFAESLKHLDYAERMYPVIDASLAASRRSRQEGEIS